MSYKQKEFYLSTFFCCCGNGEENIKKCLETAKESGLNMVEFSFVDHNTAEFGMDYCEKIGLNYIATDMDRFTAARALLSDDEDEAEIQKITAEKKNNKYLVGYYTWDEVGRDGFEKSRRLNDLFAKYDPEHLPYSIVLPSYGIYTWDKSPQNWEENTYAQYVEDYVKIVDPPVLGFDYYPFLPTWFEDKLIENDIWRDMGLMRTLADKYNKPFWFYVQSVELGPDVVGRLTQEKIQVQLMAGLAYGAKYLSYYIATNYLYDLSGNKTDRFESGKAINERVKVYGNYLFDKKITKLYHPGLAAEFDSMYFLDNLNNSEYITSAPAGTIVSEFEGDEIALMIVNKDYDDSINGKLCLKNKKSIYELDGVTGEKKLLAEDADEIDITLAAGDGMLIVLK